MDNMSNPPEKTKKKKSVSLTLYIVPNKTPYECFSDCVGTDVFQGESAKTDTRFKNTIIGLVEKSG